MRVNRRTIPWLMAALAVLTAGIACADQQDEAVADYLRRHGMLSLLEVQLEERIERTSDDDERRELAGELSRLYLEQLRSTGPDKPYRQVLLLKAEGLVERMTQAPLYELRLELLIDRYSRIEPRVELARLDLIDADERSAAIAELTDIRRDLTAMLASIEPELDLADRRASRTVGTSAHETDTRIDELRRYRSLGHYYAGWAGYSLAALEERHVEPKILVSFGWLLGAQGELPQSAEFNDSTLEYRHVAWAAIGLALSYGQSGDALSGKLWAEKVAESPYASDEVRQAARGRLLQIYAMDRDWVNANQHARFIVNQQDEPLGAADARFLAIRALSAVRTPPVGRGGAEEANKVASYAIEQLVEGGEIGHVVDLYQRFGSLKVISDGFITRYALALAELNREERPGNTPKYISVASLFAQALDAADASDYPDYREDCLLKLAYCEILAGRPQDALEACQRIIEHSLREEAIEEARWMRIAALDRINADRNRTTSDELELAVRQYIERYPSTQRSAKLILRHAMRGTIDPDMAARTLASIGEDDPIAVPARRTLVQLNYQLLRSAGYRDQALLDDTLGIVRWLIERAPDEIEELSEARARMGTIRMGLDLTLRSDPVCEELAQTLLEAGMGLLSFDVSLRLHHPEFVYRQIELALHQQRLEDAIDLLGELALLDEGMAENARILLLNAMANAWRSDPSPRLAGLIVEIGPGVLSRMSPAFPDPIGVQISSIAEMIVHAAVFLWERNQDTELRALALRLSLMVLDRGQPSEAGLRRTAMLAAVSDDHEQELEAWLRLLAAYPDDEEPWYEARYESLRVMRQLYEERAQATFDQYRVLHPDMGPEPWGSMIEGLFPEPAATLPEDDAPAGSVDEGDGP